MGYGVGMKTTPHIVLIDGKPVGIYDMPVPTKPLYEMTASVTIKPVSEMWVGHEWQEAVDKDGRKAFDDMMAEIVGDHVTPEASGRVLTLYDNPKPLEPKTYKRIDKIGRY